MHLQRVGDLKTIVELHEELRKAGPNWEYDQLSERRWVSYVGWIPNMALRLVVTWAHSRNRVEVMATAESGDRGFRHVFTTEEAWDLFRDAQEFFSLGLPRVRKG